MKSININEIKNLDLDFVIDIRETDEYASEKIEGVKNIPMMGLLMNPDTFINKQDTFYIMCAAGGRSMQACNELTRNGYNVVNLTGGINGYVKNGN